MDEHVALSKFQEALGGKHSKYEISDQAHSEIAEETKSFLKTYLPVLLLLGYVSLVSFIAQLAERHNKRVFIYAVFYGRIFYGIFFL
jgi:hypothetical protein